MLTLRPATQRGHRNFGWLDTWHSFSFGDYQDPAHEQFRALRVLNDDSVEPGQGFGTHGHRDMEILTWVLAGTLAHKDSSGSAGTLVPGDAQHMSAGRGITHSEFNGSPTEPVHFLQIWLLPERQGLPPAYEQQHFPAADRRNRLCRVAGPEGTAGSLAWRQDAHLYATLLDAQAQVGLDLQPGRGAWVQVASGRVEVNGTVLETGDGAALEDEAKVAIRALTDSEVLVFDLA